MTPQRLLDVEVMIVPSSPTATNFPPEEEEEVSSSPCVVSTIKEVTARVLLVFPSESVTNIVQSE